MPHYQHKNGGRGHVFVDNLGKFTAVGIFGDNIFSQGLDLFNPMSDVKDIADLISDDPDEDGAGAQCESCGQ